MAKRIVLIGHCGPDSSYLRMTASRAARGVQVLAPEDEVELNRLLGEGVDLLLFNRVLDYGYEETEGVAMIRRLRAKYPRMNMMLVSNFPEAQAQAVAAGALPGFGKRDLGSPRAAQMIGAALQPPGIEDARAAKPE